ncbi:Pyrroline-5-carboxylate reductase [Dissulfuribacter thermophilus]|uniref:Pyrroline-5-carboxylate reductase n=1 Tax=Dissulfuribacter thermophilus TaxID=1156395 RepID=A0A1B9F609_9BACT|nr:pyrroline-5-carboxylate reductase [Dissulfuribacter thermophilus]OCC15352.1 Pyrroline-5-carboxylate reductase [Dissulfuribacter thermophilus]
MKLKGLKIGFIGAGQMGSALIKGLIEKGLLDKMGIFASDPSFERRSIVEKDTGIKTFETNDECIKNVDIVLLAVKPQVMGPVLADIRPSIESRHLVVSIAAGISTKFIEDRLEAGTRVVRVMPNTPALVHEGAAAISPGSSASEEDLEIVREIFEAVGIAVTVPEELMDTVTGLSGSGPAYCFKFIEALIEGGILEGLPRDVAQKLAVQTVLGSARLVQILNEHPSKLEAMVTSPGGTTIRGLHALEKFAFKAGVMEAVSQATKRSKELGKEN